MLAMDAAALWIGSDDAVPCSTYPNSLYSHWIWTSKRHPRAMTGRSFKKEFWYEMKESGNSIRFTKSFLKIYLSYRVRQGRAASKGDAKDGGAITRQVKIHATHHHIT